jgi:DnaJ-class molecular chaperone
MAARKSAKPSKAAASEPAKCGPCNGTGEVPRAVRVGRKQRVVGQQTGICLACFGTGNATD